MGFGGSTGPQSHYPVAQPAHLGPYRLAALLCLHHTYLCVWRNVSWGLHQSRSLAGGSDFCCRPLKLLPCFQMYIMAGKVLQPFYCTLLFIHSLRSADVQHNMKFSLLVCSLEVFVSAGEFQSDLISVVVCLVFIRLKRTEWEAQHESENPLQDSIIRDHSQWHTERWDAADTSTLHGQQVQQVQQVCYWCLYCTARCWSPAQRWDGEKKKNKKKTLPGWFNLLIFYKSHVWKKFLKINNSGEKNTFFMNKMQNRFFFLFICHVWVE